MLYGATAAFLTVYLTEWKVIADKIPFYGGKFKEEQ